MILGLVGLAGSGKSTVADILQKDHGFVSVALADPIKRICRELFSFTDVQLWGPSEERNKPDTRYPLVVGMDAGEPEHGYLTPRHALQQLGTEFGRACYPNVWVDYGMRVAKALLTRSFVYDAQNGLRETHLVALPPGTMSPKGVVFSDIRFQNEVEAIRAAGGAVWRIVRPGAGLKGTAGAHLS